MSICGGVGYAGRVLLQYLCCTGLLCYGGVRWREICDVVCIIAHHTRQDSELCIKPANEKDSKGKGREKSIAPKEE